MTFDFYDRKSNMSRVHRPLAFLLYVLVATALLLEAILQVGALAVFLANKGATKPVVEAGDKTILCVGDSWTQGMGCSDYGKFSYPAVLEGIIRQQHEAIWTVVNGGQAGQNSADVLRRLPGQLQASHPSVVCVLVGRNDYWTNPDELTEDVRADSAYTFRWRLPRLIAFFGDAGQQHASNPENKRVEDSPSWQAKPETYVAPQPDDSVPWLETETGSSLKHQGWTLFAQENLTEAIAAFEAAVDGEPKDSDALLGLVNCLRRSGSSDRMQLTIEAMRRNHGEGGSYRHARALCRALVVAGNMQEALGVAKDILVRFPEDWAVWFDRAMAEYQLEMTKEAVESIGKCVEGWPCRATWELHYAILRKSGDLPASLTSIFRGYQATNDHRWALRWFSNALSDQRVRDLQPEKLLGELDCPADVKERLSLILEDAFRKSDGTEASRVLSAHLRRIVRLAKDAGALTVFLTYPEASEDSSYGQPLRIVAAELGVQLIDVTSGVAKRLGGRPWTDIRSPDWHVNDEGYRFMAECVFEGLQPVLQSLK